MSWSPSQNALTEHLVQLGHLLHLPWYKRLFRNGNMRYNWYVIRGCWTHQLDLIEDTERVQRRERGVIRVDPEGKEL